MGKAFIDPPPDRKKHRPIVSPREMYQTREGLPDEMVWDMCRHRRFEGPDMDCHECPAWAEDPYYGRCQRICYGLADEACRLALAWAERLRKLAQEQADGGKNS